MDKALSTWIVPPMYEVVFLGVDAIEITARKIHLIIAGKRVMSCGKKVDIAGMTTFQLVAYVRSQQGV